MKTSKNPRTTKTQNWNLDFATARLKALQILNLKEINHYKFITVKNIAEILQTKNISLNLI